MDIYNLSNYGLALNGVNDVIQQGNRNQLTQKQMQQNQYQLNKQVVPAQQVGRQPAQQLQLDSKLNQTTMELPEPREFCSKKDLTNLNQFYAVLHVIKYEEKYDNTLPYTTSHYNNIANQLKQLPVEQKLEMIQKINNFTPEQREYIVDQYKQWKQNVPE
ncbi:Hypothetical_protein [Hexamita inflata]|uniref:Hypothetical_protein n=1 Tax=Hexamita inflata TaxID=28002 RepID=A0AA86TU94_9EUKA|nr:Hypothetical protein HINF_LOCUS16410 [Hexamita inflata]